MLNTNLIKEQILLRLPNSVWIFSSSDKQLEDNQELIYLDVENFGRITMYNNFDIQVTYKNIYNVQFKYFKEFFESRLKFDNASIYIYEDRIKIFKRIMTDYGRNDFENSMLVALNFIHTADSVLSFVKYNKN